MSIKKISWNYKGIAGCLGSKIVGVSLEKSGDLKMIYEDHQMNIISVPIIDNSKEKILVLQT